MIGTGVAILGAALLAQRSSDTSHRVTVAGDLASFSAAVLFVVYINMGRRLRQWMPLVSESQCHCLDSRCLW